jgi:tRNA G18 (ribose-2'-O)-methylase SpoU
MQAQGYTIIAVEQTINSKNLYEFQFPEKTLLLLGYMKRNSLFFVNKKSLCF